MPDKWDFTFNEPPFTLDGWWFLTRPAKKIRFSISSHRKSIGFGAAIEDFCSGQQNPQCSPRFEGFILFFFSSLKEWTHKTADSSGSGSSTYLLLMLLSSFITHSVPSERATNLLLLFMHWRVACASHTYRESERSQDAGLQHHHYLLIRECTSLHDVWDLCTLSPRATSTFCCCCCSCSTLQCASARWLIINNLCKTIITLLIG